MSHCDACAEGSTSSAASAAATPGGVADESGLGLAVAGRLDERFAVDVLEHAHEVRSSGEADGHDVLAVPRRHRGRHPQPRPAQQPERLVLGLEVAAVGRRMRDLHDDTAGCGIHPIVAILLAAELAHLAVEPPQLAGDGGRLGGGDLGAGARTRIDGHGAILSSVFRIPDAAARRQGAGAARRWSGTVPMPRCGRRSA